MDQLGIRSAGKTLPVTLLVLPGHMISSQSSSQHYGLNTEMPQSRPRRQTPELDQESSTLHWKRGQWMREALPMLPGNIQLNTQGHRKSSGSHSDHGWPFCSLQLVWLAIIAGHCPTPTLEILWSPASISSLADPASNTTAITTLREASE